MSEQRAAGAPWAQTETSDPLQPIDAYAIIEVAYVNVSVAQLDLAKLERMLIPLLNQVRAMQGKEPMYPPKG